MNAVAAFNQVRDIPYKIPLSPSEEDCCCSGKAKRLKQLLENEGYAVRYRVCEFHWSELGLPHALLAVPHEDNSTHSYIETLLDKKWIQVDPTWDIEVKGILHKETWDGKTSTTLAVKPFNTFSPEKSKQIMEGTTDEEITADLKINGAFYEAFNEWLEKKRVK